MKKYFLSLLCCSLCFITNGQIIWQKCLGGQDFDQGFSVVATSDKGSIIAGGTYSGDGDISFNHSKFGEADAWIIKLTKKGSIEWQKCLGGSNTEYALAVVQTPDNGYIFAGQTASADGDVSGLHVSEDRPDFWVVKLSASGSIEWQKCLGGTHNDGAYSVCLASDGGYVVAGAADSDDGDVIGNHGFADAWVVKLSATGSIEWQKCFGGDDDDLALCIVQAADGGYIMSGATFSFNGDVSGAHGSVDGWVVKLSAAGNIQWQKCLGGSAGDVIWSIAVAADGGYIAAGSTASGNGDVYGHNWGDDYWIVKLSASGDIQWQKCMGTNRDEAYSVAATADGGYIVAGSTDASQYKEAGTRGGYDYWVIKLSASGTEEWQKYLGGNGDDGHTGSLRQAAITQAADGNYMLCGITTSNDVDVSGNHGECDVWVVKLGPYVGVTDIHGGGYVSITPNPAKDRVTITGAANVQVKIYNAIGQQVIAEKVTNDFSVAALPAGMYIIQIFNSAGEMVLRDKLVKN